MPFEVKSFCLNLTHDGERKERGEERQGEKERKKKVEREQEKDKVIGRGIDKANDFKLGVKNLRQRRR